MAVAHENSTAVEDATSISSKTVSFACGGSDRCLLMGWGFDVNISDVFCDSMTYNGVSVPELHEGAQSFVLRSGVGLLQNPASGTNNAVFNLSVSSAHSKSFVVANYTGVDQTTPNRTQQNTGSGTSSSPSITCTTGQTGDLILDFVAARNGITATVGADQVERVNFDAAGGLAPVDMLMSEQAGSTSAVMSWGGTAAHWRSIAVPLIPSAGAPAATPRLALLGVG